jgi:hypothetical protein
MRRDFGLMVLGVLTGGVLVALSVYLALNWTTHNITTAAMELPPPLFFIPK